jgi:hypothetical protein
LASLFIYFSSCTSLSKQINPLKKKKKKKKKKNQTKQNKTKQQQNLQKASDEHTEEVH